MIDAYVLPALRSHPASVKIALLREAVRIGNKLRAEEIRAPRAAAVWTTLSSRPYLRAVHNLALDLWQRNFEGDRSEAITLASRVLKLNPNDNRGMRYLLVAWMPALGRWDGAARLKKRSRAEIRTETRYWLALHAYREAHHAEAEALLTKALETNHHVPAFPALPVGPPGYRVRCDSLRIA